MIVFNWTLLLQIEITPKTQFRLESELYTNERWKNRNESSQEMNSSNSIQQTDCTYNWDDTINYQKLFRHFITFQNKSRPINASLYLCIEMLNAYLVSVYKQCIRSLCYAILIQFIIHWNDNFFGGFLKIGNFLNE